MYYGGLMLLLCCQSDAAAAQKTAGALIPKRGKLKILSAAARNEHGFIGQLLLEIIGPRFSAEVCLKFTS
jgi:hypothetical protein